MKIQFITVVVILNLLILTSCGQNNATRVDVTSSPDIVGSPSSETQSGQDSNMIEVTVYYPDSNAEFLQKEKTTVKENDKYTAVLEQCVKNSSALPKNLKILGTNLKDKTCTVNLSQEINQLVGSTATIMGVYAMVNSLCAFDEVDNVVFLVEGKQQSVLDQLIFDEPFTFDASIVAK